MKHGAIDHPKMSRLARRLGVARYAAVGLMETLWHWVAEYAIDGDLERYSDEDLEHAIGWDGEPGAFVGAALDAGFMEPRAETRDPARERAQTRARAIHSWSEHAPDYIHARLAREGRKFSDGTPPKLTRLHSSERAKASEKLGLTETRAETRGNARKRAFAPGTSTSTNTTKEKTIDRCARTNGRTKSAEKPKPEPEEWTPDTEPVAVESSPVAEELAGMIEAAGPGAKPAPRRRTDLAFAVAELGEDTVRQAVDWIVAAGCKESADLLVSLQRYSDGCSLGRIGFASRKAFVGARNGAGHKSSAALPEWEGLE